ncbi:unnamed protein product [Miscanthus lutarioriparius]|uniref:Ribosomal protein L9 domain-containing protein n=1 Tax=Miscanthus lutarioriparius TaxID=422564 RepID=A0A811ML33_9POAL|nr:unnamed protein product [Miscanthus lutarioriparius]
MQPSAAATAPPAQIDDVEAVGKKGATMKVRAGFYRKLLLPKGKPTLLTPEVLK